MASFVIVKVYGNRYEDVYSTRNDFVRNFGPRELIDVFTTETDCHSTFEMGNYDRVSNLELEIAPLT